MKSARTIVLFSAAMLALVLAGPIATAAQAPRLRVGGQVAAPKKIRNVSPIYPEAAKANHIQGVVAIEVVVATDGRIIDTDVKKSVPELDDAALTAVRQWEYTPTLLNGEPVEVVMMVTISFTLAE